MGPRRYLLRTEKVDRELIICMNDKCDSGNRSENGQKFFFPAGTFKTFSDSVYAHVLK